MKSKYPKIFVVGCPRSGTTWLAKMISSHPNVVATQGESHVYNLIYEPFTYLTKIGFKKRLRNYKSILNYYGLLPLIRGIEVEDIWQGIINTYKIYQNNNGEKGCGIHQLVSETDLKETIHNVRQHQGDALMQAQDLIECLFDYYFYQLVEKEKQATSLFLEKTPMHLRYVDVILRQFPEAKIIEIIRDGRDVCVSFAALAQKKNWSRKMQGQNSAVTMNYWKRCIDIGNKFRANPDLANRIHLVFYEQLRLDTYHEVAKILDFSNLTYNPLMLKSIININDINTVQNRGEGEQTRKGSIGEWRNRLSPSEINKCLEIGGKNLREMGYTID